MICFCVISLSEWLLCNSDEDMTVKCVSYVSCIAKLSFSLCLFITTEVRKIYKLYFQIYELHFLRYVTFDKHLWGIQNLQFIWKYYQWRSLIVTNSAETTESFPYWLHNILRFIIYGKLSLFSCEMIGWQL